MTTGIFARISAEAAEEDRAEGKNVIPYWRLVKDDGTLNPKFPGGVDHHAEQLEKEGFFIVPKGRTKLMVKGFESLKVVL